MAANITNAAAREFYLSGVRGEPKPKPRAGAAASNRVIWTPEMVHALRELRAKGTAIYWCAHEIGVSYPVAVMKCRELGLADRRNRGRTPGELLAAE